MIEKLWGAPVGSREGDKLDVLATLVDAYESKHFPLSRLDPVDTIKVHMEMTERTQSDLAELLGSKSRLVILNRKRALNLEQVRQISEAWKIPAGLLIEPYALQKNAA